MHSRVIMSSTCSAVLGCSCDFIFFLYAGWAGSSGVLLIRMLCKRAADYQFANTAAAFLRAGLCGKAKRWSSRMVLVGYSSTGQWCPRGCHHRAPTQEPFSVLARALHSVCQMVTGSFVFLSLCPLLHRLKNSWLCFLVKHFSTRAIKMFRDFWSGLWRRSRLHWTWQPDLSFDWNTFSSLSWYKLFYDSVNKAGVKKWHVLFGFCRNRTYLL